MNSLIALLALVACVIINVEAQPRNDVKFGNIPYFVEQINPVLNRHRNRYRAFAGQKGSPIANIRAGRSIQDNKINPVVECVYAFESLFCAGVNNDGKETQVECDAQENFNNIVGFENVTSYALSDLRILKTSEHSQMTKMYMFGKQPTESTFHSTWMSYIVKEKQTQNRNVLSVHSAADKLNDQGITILDSGCWEKMVTFFKGIKTVDQVDLLNNQKPIKIIASLNVL